MNIYRNMHPKTIEYTSSSNMLGPLYEIPRAYPMKQISPNIKNLGVEVWLKQ
jgi:hypothetical protein